ncbi:MAG: O-antigen ligase family protein [Phycisphaeraceae bacterium]|nr:O-antigen ligase family protein [Phycisphaeraceae bacterium]
MTKRPTKRKVSNRQIVTHRDIAEHGAPASSRSVGSGASALPTLDGAAWCGLLLVGIGLALSLVRYSPRPLWELDPVYDIQPLLMIGPVGLTFSQLLVVALAGLGLMLAARTGRVPWRGWVVLLVPAFLIALAYMHLDPPGRAVSGAWAAGAAAALSLAVLGRDLRLRLIFGVMMLAMAMPWAADAFAYVWIDHPRMLETFRADEAGFLKARGWSEGSPEHTKFLRRLMFSDATGPFGLSNVFGTWLAGVSALGLVVLVGWFGPRRWQAWVTVGVLLLSLTALYLTRARGAMLVLAMAAPWLMAWALLMRLDRDRSWIWRLAGIMGIMAPLLVILGIVAVGLLIEPTPQSPWLSLIFRSHYWQSTTAMIADSPWLGTAPGRFQEAYQFHRLAISPEVVTSTHSAVLDWTAMLGVMALGWIVLIGWWFWSASQRLGRPDSREASPSFDWIDRERAFALALVLTLALAAFKWWFELLGLIGWSGWIRNLGMLGFFLVCWVGLTHLDGVRARWLNVGIWAMALVVWSHGQMDMAFHHPTSAMLGWMLLGMMASCIGGGACDDGTQRRAGDAAQPAEVHDRLTATSGRPLLGMGLGVGLMTIALVWMVWVAFPVHRQHQWMAEAADALRDHRVLDTQRFMLHAADAMPRDPFPVWRSVEISMGLAGEAREQGDSARAVVMLLGGLNQLDRLGPPHDAAINTRRLRVGLLLMLDGLTGEAEHRRRAIEEMEAMVRQAPVDTRFRIQAADLLWRFGRTEEAVGHYRQALRLDELHALDPADQLSETARSRARARSEAGEGR